MNKLVILGLAAALLLVAVPTAAAHFVVGYPDPTTGECTGRTVPGTDGRIHGGIGIGHCRVYHLP